ncbi:hypothetical protein [Saccharopolyspora antimicrobica]|uniref:hypothetical protein n=1 Tax=Saccharopolyspora antimicrobica TaxID=455193 RepID=UPI00116017CB|nr:hypothetical protein [Saccharopolyspora antimicrobica]
MGSDPLARSVAQVDDDEFRQTWSGDEFVTWLPIVLISDTGMWLGVDRGGEWVLGRLEGMVSRGRPLPQSWLTVLDDDEVIFRERLEDAAARYRLPAVVIQANVPVDEILDMAFRSRSPYWAERAMRWLVNRSSTECHLERVRELAAARWPNQWTRQTAKRLVAVADRSEPPNRAE